MQLKKTLNLTDGNLNFHLKKLESAQLISIVKTFEHNKPKTRIFITELGYTTTIAHLDYLKSLISSIITT